MSAPSSSASTPAEMAKFRSQLECPICTLIPIGRKIYMCTQGHNICSECLGRLPKDRTVCPQGRCAYPVPPLRNRAIEDILAVAAAGGSSRHVLLLTPKIPCENAAGGCSFRSVCAEMKDHESRCSFRNVPCPEINCRVNPRAKELIQHIKKDHTNVVFIQANQEGVSTQKWLMKKGQHVCCAAKSRPTSLNWNMVVCTQDAGNAAFGIRLVKRENMFHTWVSHLVSEESIGASSGGATSTPNHPVCEITVKSGKVTMYKFRGNIQPALSTLETVVDGGGCLSLGAEIIGKCVSPDNISTVSRKAGFDLQLTVEYKILRPSVTGSGGGLRERVASSSWVAGMKRPRLGM